jgi:molecular chaperone GrpE
VSEHPDQAAAPATAHETEPDARPASTPGTPTGEDGAAADPASQGAAGEGDALAAAVVGALPEDGGDATAGATPDGEDPEGAEESEDPRTREELLVAVRDAERQRDEYLDDLRRARAEFENYRRRTSREAALARDVGRGDVATALLDVLDDLDRTLAASEDSADTGLAKGVSLVAEKLSGTLASLGLVRLDPLGDPFDPAEHEAVQQVPNDEPLDPPVVESTLRPGYRLGARVLRPAMVVVRG